MRWETKICESVKKKWWMNFCAKYAFRRDSLNFISLSYNSKVRHKQISRLVKIPNCRSRVESCALGKGFKCELL